MQAYVTLQDKIIEGQTRLPITYSGSGKISFSNCVINAERIFNYTDVLGFSYTEIHDHWWTNPADIDFYNKVTAHTSSINSLVIDNFTNMTAFVNAMGANGEQVLDMAGRSIYNLELPLSVVEIRNALVTNNANIPANGRDITVRNCQFGNASVTCRYLSVYDSRINFYMEPSLSAMWGYNSEIRSGSDFVNKAIQYIFEDCKIGINFKRVTDNDARDTFLEFTRCNFENCVIEAKTLTMKNCDCDGCTIKIYPYKENDIYKMYCYLEGNRFISGNPVDILPVFLFRCVLVACHDSPLGKIHSFFRHHQVRCPKAHLLESDIYVFHIFASRFLSGCNNYIFGLRNPQHICEIQVKLHQSFAVCYHETMLQRRRVFDLTNTIMNYLFLVFLLLCGIYLTSFWFELKSDFLTYLVSVINVAAWTISALALLMVCLAVYIAIADKDLKALVLLWCILRMAVCIALSIIIDACSILISEGVSVSL